jgi:hypothetical protein
MSLLKRIFERRRYDLDYPAHGIDHVRMIYANDEEPC